MPARADRRIHRRDSRGRRAHIAPRVHDRGAAAACGDRDEQAELVHGDLRGGLPLRKGGLYSLEACRTVRGVRDSRIARLSLLVDDTALKIIMLALLPLTAVFVLTSRTFLTEKEPRSRAMTTFLAVIVAAVIGAYDGFYGPGTGTFLILFLTTVARMRLTTANGITKAINFSSNIAALTVFLIHGQAIVPLGLTAGVFSVVGNYLGTRVFDKKGARAVKPVMLTVIAVFFVKVLYELLSD